MEQFTASDPQRQPFHVAANNSSSNRPVASLQKPTSFDPARSKSRSHDAQVVQQPNGTPFETPREFERRLNTPEPQPRSHSRSGSFGGVKEGVANLNRWSKSSGSPESKGSHHRRSSSFSRRMSFGGPGAFNFGIESSPKKLQKNRPSTAHSNSNSNSPSRQDLASRFSKTSGPPPILPPILTLPSLQTSVIGDSPLTGSPSTAGLLSAAYRSTAQGEDYFTSSWTVQTRDFSQKRPRSQDRSRSTSADPPHSSGTGSVPNVPPSHTPTDEGRKSRGHSRHRSQAGNTSEGTVFSRNSKQPSQKAMLSKALQKANTAVLLDNAQNFDGAMQAYSEACALLQQVMQRSSGDEDRRKLEAIRSTYTARIAELKKIAPHLRDDGKALPARPESGDPVDDLQSPDEEDELAIIETATVTRIVNDQSFAPEYQLSRSIPPSQVPQRRESLVRSALETVQHQQYNRSRNMQDVYAGRSFSQNNLREPNGMDRLAPPESQYMPPPLSPRRPSSPMEYEAPPMTTNARQQSADLSSSNLSGSSAAKTHTRAASNESMSWLDTIDESGGSTASSVHSRTSSMGMRRKHIRAASGATEAEFDAALDAAVEAAYDEGYEPVEALQPSRYDYGEEDEVVLNVRRRVEMAKERVRQSEREAAIEEARDRERRRLLQNQQDQRNGFDYDGNESEEEERMLEEMTRGFVMDDFEFGLQSKSALPRESDSSGFSGRTWNSSIGSNPTTAATTLSTVTEASTVPQIPSFQSRTPPPFHPPPLQALPPPPNSASQPPSANVATQSVRSRRLSGQNAKQLKIETTTKALVGQPGPLSQPPSLPPPQIPTDDAIRPKTVGLRQRQPLIPPPSNRPPVPQSARNASSPFPQPSPVEIVSPPTPTLTRTFTNESETAMPRSGSPGRPQSRTGLRKNYSSSSLKNLRGRNLSVSNFDDGSDASPSTPLSSPYNLRDSNNQRLPAMPALPTPIATAFKDRMNGAPTGGMFLFDSDIHSPESPGSPNMMLAGAPIPLEPCPTEFLLRPFWLMRALYQTIAHPRGGYLSTKLFIPRDVWKVKGVKMRNVEDKISNLDFLTAALLKLAQVDTFDADAVLEEMQSLEGVLEQVQAALAKKLGSEVGVQGSGGMFKDNSFADAETSNLTSKTGSVTNKSSSFSWRRLRSKNSAANLQSSYANKTPVEGPKEGLTMSTLPMTSNSVAKTRFPKRDVSQVQFSGPNASYMGSLARLFDAAQALDQIARQVEDPGLRHADKTQVGLELCTRHASEFFGFYICRFVLTDIGMLLDKFIKRGSEWVLV